MNPTRVVVAGNSFDDTSSEPFRWQPARGLTLLGDVANGTRHTVANAISTDGRVICGQSVLATGFAACCWSADRGWTILPTPAGAESNALGVNLDGSSSSAPWTARRRSGTAAACIRRGKPEEHGIELPGWHLAALERERRHARRTDHRRQRHRADGLETAWIAVVPAKRS
jgi:uncharacterized membrane protein